MHFDCYVRNLSQVFHISFYLDHPYHFFLKHTEPRGQWQPGFQLTFAKFQKRRNLPSLFSCFRAFVINCFLVPACPG